MATLHMTTLTLSQRDNGPDPVQPGMNNLFFIIQKLPLPFAGVFDDVCDSWEPSWRATLHCNSVGSLCSQHPILS